MRPGRGTARRVYERVSVHAEAKSTNPTLWHDLGAPITEPRRPLPDFGVLPSPPRAPDGRMPTPHRPLVIRSEEHTSELQSLMRISYAVFCLKKKNTKKHTNITPLTNKQSTKCIQ